MRPLKVKLSIVLDEDVHKHLLLLAKEQSRSFSGQVNYILKQFLEKVPPATRPLDNKSV